MVTLWRYSGYDGVVQNPTSPEEGGEGVDSASEKSGVVTISIRFKEALLEELRQLAEEHNRSFNGTVNEACKRFVRQMKPRTPRDPAGNGDAGQ
jgi:hypothetical protein